MSGLGLRYGTVRLVVHPAWKDAFARETYAAAKRALAERYADDRRSYSHAKGDVIARLLS